MHRFYSLLLLLLSCMATTWAQSEAPTFSSADAPKYHRVKFSRSGFHLQDNGNGQKLTVKAETNTKQLFAFIGTESDFVLMSSAKNYVTKPSGSDHLTATSALASALHFALVSKGNGYFELSPTSDRSKAINQWGAIADGMNLGLWSTGDQNNSCFVVDPADYLEYSITSATSFSAPSRHTLWYKKPAYANAVSNVWMEYSLPIGNGQLGASLFGGVRTDEIQFNEKTLWQGGPNDMGAYGKYMNFGSVIVKNLGTTFDNGSKRVRNYVRFLDIDNGLSGVNYTDDAATFYTQRYLASAPDGVIAAQYKAVGSNKLHLRFSLKAGAELNDGGTTYNADGTASFGGKLQTVFHHARFKVVPVGGTMKHTTTGIEVEGASEVLLILCGGTSFDSSVPARTSGNATTLATRLTNLVNAAAARSWDELLARHTADFSSYTNRVNFTLDRATAGTFDTEALINYYNRSAETKRDRYGLFLEELYFHFGRYLSISSSRGVNVPNNLQGLWNNLASAPWNSDIHTNINVQMNYWPTEPTNLSDCHLPFLNYIIDNAASPNWQAAARRGGQSKGWSVFTESNIFGGMSTWGDNYFVANAWYVSHLWQHYRYTLDRDFLRRAFPAMWSSAEFWMERMIQDRGHAEDKSKNIPAFAPDGTWVCPNEYSAEQNDHPREDATAHAQQLVMANLNCCLEAVEILGLSEAGITAGQLETLRQYVRNTDTGLHTETYTGKWGEINGVKVGDTILREWKYAPYSVSNDQAHRHMSHLMCLYPLSQVQPGDGYFEAAVKSLALRGDAATGWSMGWKVNLWARAKDGNHAHIILRNALRHSTSYSTDQYAGGIYYNLYDSHAPFQIDGNFGVCAGIAELLLQSHTGLIEILPALPKDWKAGSISGLKAVGDFEVAIEWANNKPTKVSIKNNQGQPLRIKGAAFTAAQVSVGGEAKPFTEITENGETIALFEGMSAGQVLNIDYTKDPTAISALPSETKVKAPIYDLSGRRASASSTGLLVQGGKKFVR